MFTYFTDRDGKFQLGTLKESAFDPLARTCQFMLKEEAHHMFVGITGLQRVVERTAELMRRHDTEDIWHYGGIPLDIIQRYLNFHFSVSMDLFGSEVSTNAANYFTAGLKGRWMETRRTDDHRLLDQVTGISRVRDGSLVTDEVPALSALNLDLRREYVADCATGVKRWNRELADAGRRTGCSCRTRASTARSAVTRARTSPRRVNLSTRRRGSGAVTRGCPRRWTGSASGNSCGRYTSRASSRAGSRHRRPASTAPRQTSNTSGSTSSPALPGSPPR